MKGGSVHLEDEGPFKSQSLFW